MSLEPSLEGVGDGVGELDDSARERGDFIAELEEEVSEWGVGRDKLSVREGRKEYPPAASDPSGGPPGRVPEPAG